MITKPEYRQPNWQLILLIAVVVIMWLVANFGCTTQKKATGYFNRHALIAAEYCANAFPVRDSVVYKPGQIIKRSDTLYIPGDSIPCPPGATQVVTKPIYVQCPPTKIIIDSLLIHDTISVIRENTAKTASLTDQLAITTTKQKDAENGRRNWRKWALITWTVIIIGGGGYLLAKFKLFI